MNTATSIDFEVQTMASVYIIIYSRKKVLVGFGKKKRPSKNTVELKRTTTNRQYALMHLRAHTKKKTNCVLEVRLISVKPRHHERTTPARRNQTPIIQKMMLETDAMTPYMS